jgi:glycosyltransferase involved in cell wall biosynthesis
MNKRAILNVAFPFAKISEKTAGGSEQVLKELDKAIIRSGNRSVVLAQKGSSVEGELIECDSECDIIDDLFKAEVYKKYRSMITDIINERKIDLVHFHGLDFIDYFPSEQISSLVTLHLPVQWYKEECFSIGGIHFNCVSRFQFNSWEKRKGRQVSVIENGVNIPEKIPYRKAGTCTLSMGRICPEKGFHLAIEASRKAEKHFVLAGRVYPYEEHIRYFQKKILPAINSNECLFVGEAGNEEKEWLFNHALCLLVPSMVEETSSLVAMEAMANGVPVIAFKAGALKEIIRHGESGYLVSDEKEMAEAILEIGKIDPERCYSIASENYSVTRMTSQYLQLYEKIIGG